MQAYGTAIESLKRCDDGALLAISYAFGDVEMKSRSSFNRCEIVVSVVGELTSQGARQKFICNPDVLADLSWLHQGRTVRTRPPVNELRQFPICETVKQ